MSRAVPTINTQRLTLRGMRAEDFARYAEIWSMPEVAHHITGTPWRRSKAWDDFLRIAGHWQITGFGQWAVQRHRAADISGQVGFFYGRRDLGEDFDSVPEAAWVLTPDAHGQGLGLEAARAAHDWFDRVITGPLVCMIRPAHEKSLRIAKSMGYATMRETRYNEQDVTLMVRKAPPQ
jgi:RimJ/RimL family protein N-acetyltransferase